MSTYSLTLREIKGSALTYAELDGNFLYLQSQIGSAGSSGGSGSSGSSGSSGTSGIGISGSSGSSGTSGQDGSSGTSGQDGSSGTSGQDGSSGSSGQTGAAGTSGSSGTSAASTITNFNYSTTNPAGGTAALGIISHNNTVSPGTLAFLLASNHNQFYICGFVPETTVTIDGIGIFGGGGNNYTASVAAAIYDSRTQSVVFGNPQQSGGNLTNLALYPNNLITSATFSANPPLSSEYSGAGLYFKTITPVQLQGGVSYFIGSYGSASQIGATNNWTQGTLPPRPQLGFALPSVTNGTIGHTINLLMGFYAGTTFSVAFPFTIATSSFPAVMPDNVGLTFIGAQTTLMRWLPLRIKSIP